MANALSIDLEYWHSSEVLRKHLPDERDDQIVEAVMPILELLDKYRTKATFFVLGQVAGKYPQLVKTIFQRGHEVASHGYSHRRLHELGEAGFEKEIKQSIALLHSITGEKPIGFRAPTFSLDNSTKWALRILAEQGFKYDSSIFPVKTMFYGVPKAPLHPYRPSLDDITKNDPKGQIIEFPLTTLKLWGIKIPVAGSFYLRVLPFWFLKFALRMVNRRRPAIIYFHPWETYPKTPRLKKLPIATRFVTYHGINSALKKVEGLLKSFEFQPVRKVLSSERGIMKILFITEYYPPHIGGVEVVVQNLAQGLVKLGYQVDVVTCRLPGSAPYEKLEGVNIHRVWVPTQGGRYWFSFLSIPKASRLAKRCDIVHAGGEITAFPAWWVATLLRKKKVVTVHGVLGALWVSLMGMGFFSAKLHQALERILMSLPFDRYVCVSKYAAKDCLELMGGNPEKLQVIHNGINYDLFAPEQTDGSQIRRRLGLEDNFIYMCSGRPVTVKGIEYLIKAVPYVTKKIPNSKLLLLMAKEPKNKYENIKRLIRQLDVEDYIRLLDPVPWKEMPNYIAAADCVVVPSLCESFGFSAAEACAMGKPVVATDAGSLPEVVSGRYVLVEPRNPQAIAEAVSMIYHNQVEDTDKKIFNWEESVRGYLEVYKEVIGS